MPILKHDEAKWIVFSEHVKYVPPGEIREELLLEGLRLDGDARIRIYQGLVHGVEALGFLRGRFSVDAVLEAVTVADIIEALLTGTDSGGPKYRP